MAANKFLILLLAFHLTLAQSDWDQDTPFSQEDTSTDGVTFYDSDRDNTRIAMEEEMTGPDGNGVRIAKMNYRGDEAPVITGFDESKTNEDLGAEAVQDTDGSWHLVITKPQDYEKITQQSYRFFYNTGTAQTPVSHRVALNILDIDDNPPSISMEGSECKIPENAYDDASKKCFFNVRDADTVGNWTNLRFEIQDSNSGQMLFEMETDKVVDKNNLRAVLKVNQPGLDFETFSLHVLTIIVTDDADNKGQSSFVIQVEDLPDKPPVWKTIYATVNVLELEEKTITVLATDGDVMINADIWYRLEFPDMPAEHQQYFTIEADLGVITVHKINRDDLQTDVFQFNVIAYEKEDPSSSTPSTIIVIVEDINNNSPQISPATLKTSIDEGTSVQLALSIEIRDPDLGKNGQFSVSLEDSSGHDWHTLFMVIPSAGYQTSQVFISVTNASALDYEEPDMRNIILQLVATEATNSSHVGRRDVMIELNDLNDEFPLFGDVVYTALVRENAKKGDPVLTILATDRDAEDKDKVRHSLTTGERMLVIEELTGVITVAQDYAFDFEMQDEVIFQVLAQDTASPPHKTFVTLTVTVEDVNDTPPDLEMPMDAGSLEEDSVVGTEVDVAVIRATDQDTMANLTFSIDWDSSFATKQGVRVGNTTLYRRCIQIVTTYPDPSHKREATATLKVEEEKVDWGVFDTLIVKIVVTDHDTLIPEFDERKQTSATLTINIVDINNRSPEFTDDTLSARRTVVELSLTDQLIGNVVAIDEDGPPFNDVKYRLEEVDTNLDTGLVKLDEINGELRVFKDRGIVLNGVNETLKYKIFATDGNRTSQTQIEIAIIDTNNNIPQIVLEKGQFSVVENTGTGHPIVTVKYTDADVRDEYKTSTFELDFTANPSLKNLISIDPSTGELRVDLTGGAILDREPPGQERYDVTVILRDNWQQGNSEKSNENSTTISLILLDVNDNAPSFQVVDGCLVKVLENTTQGSIIFSDVYAEDLDNGVNGSVTYFLDGYESGRPIEGLPEKLFSISTVDDRGQIRVLADLMDLWGQYSVLLSAVDNPEDKTNQSRTEHTYQICVEDINNNAPAFVFPQAGQIVRLREAQTVGSDLLDTNNKTMRLIEATDDDDGDNALVTFTLEGSDEALKYFEVDNKINQRNKARLILKKELDVATRTFQLKINGEDSGSPVQLKTEIDFTLRLVPEGNLPPVFDDFEQSLTFTENEGGMDESFPVYEATDEDNADPTEPEKDDIFYFILDAKSTTPTGEADAKGVFELHPTNRVLRLSQPVDREMTSSFVLTILATNDEQQPPDNTVVDPTNPSQLTVMVTIADVNDSPPKFEKEIFSGGIATGDKNGHEVLRVMAVDPDLDDPVTYERSSPVTVSDSSLNNIKDRAFAVNSTTGAVTLMFDPSDQMSGYFEFKVRATDCSEAGGEDHMGYAGVKVFVISASNRVTFRFRNDVSVVEGNSAAMTDIFSDVINYNCSMDSVFNAVDEDGVRIENQTDVVTHFIDPAKNEAVEATKITEIVSSREIMNELQSRFWDELKLDLFDYDQGGKTGTESLEGLLQIVLIVVCVVLGTLVIILFAAFFLKTRSLNRRLEALSTTKFGSQDSGLNRVGMAAPNTNKHAVEGSNPVWNEQIKTPDYDVVSEDSYDSDMIGVEERPEFETTDSHEGLWSSEGSRRVSLNPLSIAGVGANPLGNGDASLGDMDSPVEDVFGNPEHSNFSFGKPISDL